MAILARLSEDRAVARLLCMTGTGNLNAECRSGVPSLLGRTGGTGLAAGRDERTGRGAVAICDFPEDARFGREVAVVAVIALTGLRVWDGMDDRSGLAVRSCRDGFAGEAPVSAGIPNPCDDLRGGGLGGRGESRFFFVLLSLSPSRTVPFEEEEDELRDSRIAVRGCADVPVPNPPVSPDTSLLKLLDLPRLFCRTLAVVAGVRVEVTRPGE